MSFQHEPVASQANDGSAHQKRHRAHWLFPANHLRFHLPSLRPHVCVIRYEAAIPNGFVSP
jgi:hypothetical protein